MVSPLPLRLGFVVEFRVVGSECLIQIIFGSQMIDFGQSGGRFAYVELAGDDVGDEAGAVFAEKVDLTFGLIGCRVQFSRTCLYVSHD